MTALRLLAGHSRYSLGKGGSVEKVSSFLPGLDAKTGSAYYFSPRSPAAAVAEVPPIKQFP